jgi:hypothetical protein
MGTGFAAAGIDYFCRLKNISVMANVFEFNVHIFAL